MPVTQAHKELKPREELALPTLPKHVKSPFKVHAPGFDVAQLQPAEDDESSELHLAPTTNKRRSRRVVSSALPRYQYASDFSRFFAGTSAYLGQQQVPDLLNTTLRPNAKFVGEQQSGMSRYDIKVELKTVDLLDSVVTGFFQIKGLTDEHPLITTCFKGEIINNPLTRMEWGNRGANIKRYSFITEENNWSSFPKNDLEHWKKLTGCPSHYTEADLREKLQKIQAGEEDQSYVYMRWKEEFLLPDSRVKSLQGASFEGFYYIVLNIGSRAEQRTSRFSSNIIPGSMSGLYFYTQSEKFQSLSLRHVEERGASYAFDFV